MNVKHVMNHQYSTSALSPHRLAAGICTIVILTFALSHAAPSVADEIDDERDCRMLDSVDDLEKRFVAGLRSYRHSLESYRQSLTDYKKASRYYAPGSHVPKSMLNAYRSGMDAYANGVIAYQRQIEQQRRLRKRVDELKRLSGDSNVSGCEHLQSELQKATAEYTDFLTPKIYTSGRSRVNPSESSAILVRKTRSDPAWLEDDILKPESSNRTGHRSHFAIENGKPTAQRPEV